MIFSNNSHEILQVFELNETNSNIVFDVKKTDLTFIWNTAESMDITIDKTPLQLRQNQMIFLTEFHKIDSVFIEKARMVRFNQPFFCIDNNDDEIGCKGVLFFRTSDVPVVTIEEERLAEFDLSWEIFCGEMHTSDSLQKDMLQSLLKRMLILSVRILKQSSNFHKIENSQSDIVREFNYLVETHFTEHHDVAFYASKLNKSPKTLSNLFSLISERAPLNIIQDRIMMHAKKRINYSALSIKEIAYELGYGDIQTFSRFFKNKEGVSPVHYRKKNLRETV